MSGCGLCVGPDGKFTGNRLPFPPLNTQDVWCTRSVPTTTCMFVLRFTISRPVDHVKVLEQSTVHCTAKMDPVTRIRKIKQGRGTVVLLKQRWRLCVTVTSVAAWKADLKRSILSVRGLGKTRLVKWQTAVTGALAGKLDQEGRTP